jgi:hypothetical protein
MQEQENNEQTGWLRYRKYLMYYCIIWSISWLPFGDDFCVEYTRKYGISRSVVEKFVHKDFKIFPIYIMKSMSYSMKTEQKKQLDIKFWA